MRTLRLSSWRISRGIVAAAVVWISIGALLGLAGRADATTVTRVDFGGVTFEDLMVNGQQGETNDITVSFAANPVFPTEPNPVTLIHRPAREHHSRPRVHRGGPARGPVRSAQSAERRDDRT